MSIVWSKISGDAYIKNDWNNAGDIGATEDFFNQAIAEGFAPVKISYGYQYSFVPCVPGEYICRSATCLTKNGFFDKAKEAELVEMLVASGALIIPQYSSWGTKTGIFAVRSSSLGPFEITSDLDSRIAEYTARRNLHLGMALAWLALAVALGVSLNNLAFGACYLIFAFISLEPATRYFKLIAKLKRERDIQEK